MDEMQIVPWTALLLLATVLGCGPRTGPASATESRRAGEDASAGTKAMQADGHAPGTPVPRGLPPSRPPPRKGYPNRSFSYLRCAFPMGVEWPVVMGLAKAKGAVLKRLRAVLVKLGFGGKAVTCLKGRQLMIHLNGKELVKLFGSTVSFRCTPRAGNRTDTNSYHVDVTPSRFVPSPLAKVIAWIRVDTDPKFDLLIDSKIVKCSKVFP